MARRGILFLVSGPSGSGKTTLCRQLAQEGLAHYSISCTTRNPREGEVNGRDYYFLSREEFAAEVERDGFLEHAEVHGNLYGTLVAEVTSFLERGQDVVMDIDVQGAVQVRACQEALVQGGLVDLFVMPRTETELTNRLTGRGTDSEETISLRLKNALGEMEHWREYSYLLLSGERDEDYARFKGLLLAERLRSSRIVSLE